MRERNSFGWLSGILIIATFLGLYQLGSIPPGLHPEEAVSGIQAAEALRTGTFRPYYPEHTGQGGLHVALQAISMAANGSASPWALRLPGALMGILAVLGMYFLGRELFSIRVGLFAAFFMATGVWHLLISRSGFAEASLGMILIWMTYFARRALAGGEGGTTYKWQAGAAGAFLSLGFYASPFFWVMPLLLLGFVPFYYREGYFLKIAGIALAVALVLSAPLLWYFFEHPADFIQSAGRLFDTTPNQMRYAANILETLGMLHIRGDGDWLHNLPGRAAVFWPVGLLFLWGAVLGARNLWSRSHGHLMTVDHEKERFENWEAVRNIHVSFLVLFIWIILALFPAVSGVSAPDALRASPMMPAVFMLAAVGGIAVHSFFKTHLPSKVLGIGTTLILMLLVYEAFQSYFILWGKNPQVAKAFNADHAAVAEIINRLPATTPKAIIFPMEDTKVRGYPLRLQTVMFLTGTWDERDREAKNLRFYLPSEGGQLPERTVRFILR